MIFSYKNYKGENHKKPVSKAKKAINTIFTTVTVTIFAIVFCALLYILIQVIGGSTPSLFGYRFYFVLTESMSPTLEPKDIILSKIIEDNTDIDYVKNLVHEGDVVTYLGKIGTQDAYITHRVVKSEDQEDIIYFDDTTQQWMLTTKGDNNTGADSPIAISKLSAVMVTKVDIVGAVYNFVTTPFGSILLIGLPILFILCSLILRIVVIIKTPQEKSNKSTIFTEEEKDEIARKAIEEYKAVEARKLEIARQAVNEYKAQHNLTDKSDK